MLLVHKASTQENSRTCREEAGRTTLYVPITPVGWPSECYGSCFPSAIEASTSF